MKKYIGKALVFCAVITVLFIGLYEILHYSYYKALIADGYIAAEFSNLRLVHNLIVGVLIAFLPYELIFSKIKNNWFGSENKKKLWPSIIMLVASAVLGIWGCVVRMRSHYSWGTPTIHFQYLMLFFMSLCVGTLIISASLENRIVKTIIRSFAIVLNAFLMFFFSGFMGQGIIALVAMVVFGIVYDCITKKFSWKEAVVTGIVGIGGTAVGLSLKEYYTYKDYIPSFSENIFRFDFADIYMGTPFFLLYIVMSVSLVAILVWAIKMMKETSTVRAGLLLAATVLYICCFVYVFLAQFGILPCAEIQLITNRIFVTAFVLVIRTFIIIPTPKIIENESFVERLLKKEGMEEPDEIDWLMDEVKLLVNNQTLILQYLMVIDHRLNKLEIIEKKDSEEYEALKTQLEEDFETLKKNEVPLDMETFIKKVKEGYEKRNNRKK